MSTARPVDSGPDRSSAEVGLTAALGALAAAPGDIPAEALATANAGIVDAIGTMLAARDEPVVRAALSVVGEHDGGTSSVLLGIGAGAQRRLPAADAALVNATAAHAFAMDDVAWGAHPSALLMPALLAESEALGASGIALLRAYVVGYEILAELATREPDPLHATGWHPSGIIGPCAVAGALAALRGLDASRAAHAIGIAASFTGGLVANFGTPTKALHAGRIASGGVLAARLAAAGVTASVDVLERDTGLLRTVSPQRRVDVGPGLRAAPGQWRIVSHGLSLKRHPVCYSAHRVVDAAIDLAGDPRLLPQRIASIEVTLGATQAWMARYHEPRTPLEAKYSIEFAVASGLLARAAGFAQLDEAFIVSAPVRALIARTRLVLRDDRSADDPVFCPADRVVVQLDDGTLLDSGEVPYARGHARRPLDEDQRRAKFVDCAAAAVEDPAALYRRLGTLAGIDDVRGLSTAR